MNKLLPYKTKVFGWISIVSAAVLAFFYFYFGLKITMPVFAVYSSYLETKLFTTFETNFTEEIILLLFIGGFSLVVFSKEKKENSAVRQARMIALTSTIVTLIFFWLCALLFIFGNGFIAVLIINLILPFVVYLFFFHRIKNREIKKNRLQKL